MVAPWNNLPKEKIEVEFSEFAFRVILLFLPGVLCGGVVDALTIHSRRKPFTVVLRALVFGMGAYYLYGALILFEHGRWIVPHRMIFFRALQDKQVPLSVGEIGVVCLFACVEGVLYSFCSNRKWGYRLARRFGITQTAGTLDIWESTLYAQEVTFATVRDYKHDLVYDGWIGQFSDDGEKRELLLREVRVSRNSNSALLYGVGAVYLSLKKDDNITVEFPGVALNAAFKEELERQLSHEQPPTAAAEIPGSVRGNDQEGRSEPATDESAAAATAAPAPSIGASQKEVTRALIAFVGGAGMAWFLMNSWLPRHRR